MNERDLRAIAGAIPSPVNPDGSPCAAFVSAGHGIVGSRYYVTFALDFGRSRSETVGPPFVRPRDACRLAYLLSRRIR